MALAHVPAAASPPVAEWAAKPYEYLVVDQDLRMVLEEFGRNLGLSVTLTRAVQGRVRGNLPRASARGFLDALSGAYGLDWYYDGYTLSVSSKAESRSHFVELHGLSFERVAEGVEAAGLSDARYQLRPGPSAGVALVAGPPRFIELISEAIATMAHKAAPAVEHPNVMHVYRGAGAVENVVLPVIRPN